MFSPSLFLRKFHVRPLRGWGSFHNMEPGTRDPELILSAPGTSHFAPGTPYYSLPKVIDRLLARFEGRRAAPFSFRGPGLWASEAASSSSSAPSSPPSRRARSSRSSNSSAERAIAPVFPAASARARSEVTTTAPAGAFSTSRRMAWSARSPRREKMTRMPATCVACSPPPARSQPSKTTVMRCPLRRR